jgi:predicted rRNA methylase YqxC with S4 and FtsJ domains
LARGDVGPGGRVEAGLRPVALARVATEAAAQGFTVLGSMDSPVAGVKAGNVELLLHLRA